MSVANHRTAISTSKVCDNCDFSAQAVALAAENDRTFFNTVTNGNRHELNSKLYRSPPPIPSRPPPPPPPPPPKRSSPPAVPPRTHVPTPVSGKASYNLQQAPASSQVTVLPVELPPDVPVRKQRPNIPPLLPQHVISPVMSSSQPVCGTTTSPIQKSTSSSRISLRQDSSVSSDSFSQTSSPSYTTKTMEAPLLPHHTPKLVQCNGRAYAKTARTSGIRHYSNSGAGGSPGQMGNGALTKSVSTPASLQTIVRFQNDSNMSLQHRVSLIMRDIRRPSSHYPSHLQLKYRFFQVILNAVALIAIGGGLAVYMKGQPIPSVFIPPEHENISKAVLQAGAPPPALIVSSNPAPGVCLPVIVTICQEYRVPYNFTMFPNLMGNFHQPGAEQDLELYNAIVDVRCYELAALFLCSVFVPKCGSTGQLVTPCRSLCQQTMYRCGFFLEVFGLFLPDYLCDVLPESTDPDKCVGHDEVVLAKERAQKPQCQSGFQCDGSRCIPMDWHCDGHVDCEDQQDELNCVHCPNGTIHCGKDRCMSQQHQCDGKIDCPWAQDERNCLRLSDTNGDIGMGQLQVFKPELRRFVPACANSWDEEKSPLAICSLLGYSNWTSSKVRNVHGTQTQPVVKNQTKSSGRNVRFGQSNLLKTFSSCSGSPYPVVELICTNYVCGKVRKTYAESRSRLRIVGGVKSKPGDWPFLAALLGGPEKVFYCAGVLIADQWVLTASHCVGNYSNVTGWTIQLGITRRHAHSYYGQKMKVQRVVPHPQYNVGSSHDNDIALLQLASKVNFNEHLLPVCLPRANHELKPGTVCTVIGWGKKEDRDGLSLLFGTLATKHKLTYTIADSEYEPEINEVQVPVLNRDLCNSWLTNREQNVTEGMICAGYKEGGKDACQGDSGGPLLCHDEHDRERWFVGGIVSWGIKCAHPHLPGVYAYVPKYIPWIKEQMELFSDTI